MSNKSIILRKKLQNEHKRIIIKKKRPDPMPTETTRITTFKRTGPIGLTALIQIFDDLNP